MIGYACLLVAHAAVNQNNDLSKFSIKVSNIKMLEQCCSEVRLMWMEYITPAS